jgi:hypothetical protein
VREDKNNDKEDGRDARCKDTKYDYYYYYYYYYYYTYAHIFYKDVLCSYRNIN